LIMGGGIAGMHYVGMAAMRLPAITRFSPLLVTASIVLAILFSLVALLMAFDLREETRWTVARRLGSAAVMGAAISAMHYTGMAAATFMPSAAPPNLSHASSISPLGNNAIGIVTFLVLGAAILTSSMDRQAESEIRQINIDLDRRVVERTLQLEAVNQELRKEIVGRERAEKAVRESEEHLRLVIDTTPAMIHSARLDGYVDYFNKRWLAYVGVSLDDLLGWQWTKFLHPDHIPQLVDKWQISVATGKPFEAEARLRRADGEYRSMLLRKVPLRDEADSVVEWYGSATDIEDRKRAEQELRQAEEHIRAILEYSPNWIFLKNTEGRYLLVNREIERVFGMSQEQIKGKMDSEIFPPEQAVEYRANDLKVLRAGHTIEFEEVALLKDGPHTSIVHKFPLFDARGNVYAIGGVATDITERKRAEERLRQAQDDLAHIVRTQSMGQLAAAIAHEVNQPLTAIVTNASFSLRQLKGSTPNVDELRAAITEVVNDATRASAVISQIRSLLSKTVPQNIELDINQIIQDVTALLRHELTRNHISLRTELASNLSHVSGDPVQLQQVLINLIMNAIEAMCTPKDGRGKILIRSARNSGGVLVQIQDSGPGIESELANRIFEPFFTTKEKGIGMGLAISRSIIESHGGQLSLVSTSQGALFQFTLPTDEGGAS
jgi:PAS domain S-box-containing protein